VAVDKVARRHTNWNESVDAKRLVWQIVWKTRIDFGCFAAVGFLYEPLHAWQESIGVSLWINLYLGFTGCRDGVGIGKEAEQIVEAMIFQIDDDNVLDVA